MLDAPRHRTAFGLLSPFILGLALAMGAGLAAGPPAAAQTPTLACAVEYRVSSDWSGGFVAEVVLRNTGAEPIEGWALAWRFVEGETITGLWNGAYVQDGADVAVTDAGWNGTIHPGGAASVGFQATAAGLGGRARPTGFALNGQPCAGEAPPSPTAAPPTDTAPPPTSSPTSSPTSLPTSPPSPTAPPGGAEACAVDYAVSSDWGSGFVAELGVRNLGDRPIESWALDWRFAGDEAISSLWNGAHVQTGDAVRVTNASWNAALPVGGRVAIGFGAAGASRALPLEALLNGQPCRVEGAPPTPSPAAGASPTSAPPTATSAPLPTLPPGSSTWPERVFAPFVDATGWPPFPLVQVAQDEGVRHYALGFLVAASPTDCSPSWGSYHPSGGFLRAEIDALRALGGDVIPSFGGAANTELAAACPDVASLQAAYQEVIDDYALTHVDFDIEGAWVAHGPSIARRSAAIAGLQAEAAAQGRELRVWFTLPVLPTGLTPDGVNVLDSALAAGVDIAGVNIMAMDYGDSAAPEPDGRMGAYAIQAAESLHAQLGALYAARGIGVSEAGLWRKVGVTPMIGLNDVVTETFTLSDAAELRAFAEDKGFGLLSMWSANRDKECPGGAQPWVSISCSSILQEDFAFTRAFQGFSQP